MNLYKKILLDYISEADLLESERIREIESERDTKMYCN